MNLVSQPQNSDGADVVIPLEGGAAYRIGERLGQTGNVHEARHPRLEGRLALKRFPRATNLGASALEAFNRDSATAGRLRHPHVAQILESGAMQDGTPFTALEYLDGQTLKERMVGRGRFPASEILPVIRGVAAALTSAHGAGLFHRELRPENIFIANLPGYEHGFVKLLDFGACHLTAAESAEGRVLGDRTARYFAPEQTDGHSTAVDGRADQFALAAIAQRMLNGTEPQKRPASGQTSSKGRKKGKRQSQQMAVARPETAVDIVLKRALSASPVDRFESVSLFLRAFEDAMAAAGLVAVAAPSPTLVPPPGKLSATGKLAATPPADADVSVSPVPSHLAPESKIVNTSISVEPSVRPADPSSLSTKFFEEGDLQEATNFKNLVLVPEPKGRRSSPHLQFDSFDQIPTRRKPMVLVLLATLCTVGGVAWLTGARSSDGWQKTEVAPEIAPQQPPAAPPQVQAQVATDPAAAVPPSAVAPLPEAAQVSEPGAPPALEPSPRESSAAEVLVEEPAVTVHAAAAKAPAIAGAAPARVAAPASVAPAPASLAAPAPSAAVKRVAQPRAVVAPVAETPSAEPAASASPTQAANPGDQIMEPTPGMAEDSEIDAKAAADKVAAEKAAAERKRARAAAAKAETVRRRPGPLFLWSPEKQAMVPASEIPGALQ